MNPSTVVVDVDNGLAPWRQVHDQLARLITAGSLPAGTRLPTIRQLARDLGLAPGTIARTYRELELAGLVRTGRAKGTVVAESSTVDPTAALRDLARQYATAAVALGVDVATRWTPSVRLIRTERPRRQPTNPGTPFMAPMAHRGGQTSTISTMRRETRVHRGENNVPGASTRPCHCEIPVVTSP